MSPSATHADLATSSIAYSPMISSIAYLLTTGIHPRSTPAPPPLDPCIGVSHWGDQLRRKGRASPYLSHNPNTGSQCLGPKEKTPRRVHHQRTLACDWSHEVATGLTQN